jgi:hypothetical protein
MPAQGDLYFFFTGHQVFWDKVRRRAHEAAFTRAFPSFVQIFDSNFICFYHILFPLGGLNGGGKLRILYQFKSSLEQEPHTVCLLQELVTPKTTGRYFRRDEPDRPDHDDS